MLHNKYQQSEHIQLLKICKYYIRQRKIHKSKLHTTEILYWANVYKFSQNWSTMCRRPHSFVVSANLCSTIDEKCHYSPRTLDLMVVALKFNVFLMTLKVFVSLFLMIGETLFKAVSIFNVNGQVTVEGFVQIRLTQWRSSKVPRNLSQWLPSIQLVHCKTKRLCVPALLPRPCLTLTVS